MSEYQFYEFQALDRRLTQAEMAEVGSLSSRAVLTSTSAVFVYNYGDFRGRPENVLEKYFDGMLYMANWGARRLMFRFPKALVNSEALRPYCLADTITMKTTAEHCILDISLNQEEGEWIETGEGWLTRLIPLRGAILEGDYRALYLVWLRACQLELDPGDTGASFAEEEADEGDTEEDGDEGSFVTAGTLEPPVPPNLRKRDAALESCLEFFEIDPFWVEAGAEASTAAAQADEPLAQWIAVLPEADCRRLLLRAAQGEPNIALVINSELRGRFAAPSPAAGPSPRRTAGQLAARAQEKRRQAADKQRRRDERERVRRLEALAQREAGAWEEVMAGIQQRNARGYDEAVSLLRELRELADYRGEQAAFQRRLEPLVTQFSRLSSLQARLREARLIEG